MYLIISSLLIIFYNIMGNTSENKNIESNNYLYRLNSSELSITYSNLPQFSRNSIFSCNNISFEDIDKDDISYDIKKDINLLDINNSIEPNNISSNNTTNVNNAFDLFEFMHPLFIQDVYNKISKNKKIFKIVKMNKKIGRIKKNSGLVGKHNKLSEDNIIRKVKRRFHENVRLYINREYNKYCLEKKKNANINNWLKKINPNISNQIKKEDNLKWFNLKISEVFSEDVSLRYASHNLDINKKNIQKILSLNEANNVKNILNTKIENLFTKYINNAKIEGFTTIKEDIKKLEKHMKESGLENIKEYLMKYEKTAKNMKDIFNKKSERKFKKNS